jgi:hypothetical protein
MSSTHSKIASWTAEYIKRMTYPVTNSNMGYNKRVMKILFIPHGVDINTSKAQTPNKLQERHTIHVAGIKRDQYSH